MDFTQGACEITQIELEINAKKIQTKEAGKCQQLAATKISTRFTLRLLLTRKQSKPQNIINKRKNQHQRHRGKEPNPCKNKLFESIAWHAIFIPMESIEIKHRERIALGKLAKRMGTRGKRICSSVAFSKNVPNKKKKTYSLQHLYN